MKANCLRRMHSRRTAAQHVTYLAPFPLAQWQRNSSRDACLIARRGITRMLYPGAGDGDDGRAAAMALPYRRRHHRRGWRQERPAPRPTAHPPRLGVAAAPPAGMTVPHDEISHYRAEHHCLRRCLSAPPPKIVSASSVADPGCVPLAVVARMMRTGKRKGGSP
jgi:hypothetical protein